MSLDIADIVQLHLAYLRQQGLTAQEAADTIGHRLPPDGGWDDLAEPFAAALLKLRGVPEE